MFIHFHRNKQTKFFHAQCVIKLFKTMVKQDAAVLCIKEPLDLRSITHHYHADDISIPFQISQENFTLSFLLKVFSIDKQ